MSNDIQRCDGCGDFIPAGMFGKCSDCGTGLKAETHTDDETESLDSFGVEDDPVDRETVRDHGIDEFGVDSRETRDSDDGEQSQLVPEVDQGQRTLTGDDASQQTLFGGAE